MGRYPSALHAYVTRGVLPFSTVLTQTACKERDLDRNYLIEVYNFNCVMWFVIVIWSQSLIQYRME